MTAIPDFEVRSAGDANPADLVDVLSAGYGRTFTREWFEWKHRENPWGMSRSYVAIDDGGILGVVFGLPWQIRIGDQIVETSRLVDGATTPRSARRGVFRNVVAAELANWKADERPGAVLATATPEAQAAHVKNGAVALEAIQSAYRPVSWSRAAVETGVGVLDTFELAQHETRTITAWDVAALRWRLDPRSGIDYEISRLANSDTAHGVVHRTVLHRGLRTIVLTAHWGPAAECNKLIRALAWRSKALAVLAPSGPGAADPMPSVALKRGQSLLCVWDRRVAAGATPLDSRAAWALDGFDLEGVI